MVNDEQMKFRAADIAIDQYQAKGFAEVLNKFKDEIIVIYNPGNHDSVIEYNILSSMLDQPDMMVNSNQIAGTITMGDMKFQVAGNVYDLVNP